VDPNRHHKLPLLNNQLNRFKSIKLLSRKLNNNHSNLLKVLQVLLLNRKINNNRNKLDNNLK
jgi:hypothetical protein